MYRGIPYANRHIKRRQQERLMDCHITNLSHARPRTGTLDSNEVYINNKKGQLQKEVRFTEIQRQNRILLGKISSIMSKPSKQHQSQKKMNRSLNSSFRKRQMQNIQIQNAKLLKRLQERKPNYQTAKFKDSWKKQKHTIKNLSNYPFIISDRKNKKTSTSQNITVPGNMNPILELSRMKSIDGVSFLVTIRMGSSKLQIIGDTKMKKEIKVIQIERKEAIQFIEQQCKGKIQNLFERLRYDKKDQVLYLVASDFEVDDLREAHLSQAENKAELERECGEQELHQNQSEKKYWVPKEHLEQPENKRENDMTIRDQQEKNNLDQEVEPNKISESNN